jgi:Ca-activated chloride channel family protein
VGEGRGRRAIIILSDGQDRYSHATEADVLPRQRESDALVYGISLGKKPSPLFEQLAALSGGRAFHITRPQQIGATFTAIAAELRTQYLLGYAPPPGSPGWRAIEVRLARRSDARIRARAGYLAR